MRRIRRPRYDLVPLAATRFRRDRGVLLAAAPMGAQAGSAIGGDLPSALSRPGLGARERVRPAPRVAAPRGDSGGRGRPPLPSASARLGPGAFGGRGNAEGPRSGDDETLAQSASAAAGGQGAPVRRASPGLRRDAPSSHRCSRGSMPDGRACAPCRVSPSRCTRRPREVVGFANPYMLAPPGLLGHGAVPADHPQSDRPGSEPQGRQVPLGRALPFGSRSGVREKRASG